jgi:hypothetical protein
MQTYTAGVTHRITKDQPQREPTQSGCCRIRVVATDHAFIKISKDGEEAADTDFPLIARVPEYLTVSHAGVKVTVFAANDLCEVYVTEIS